MDALTKYQDHAKHMQQITEKWGEAGLLEGVDARKQVMTATLLENQQKEVNRLNENTTTAAVSTYNKLLIPIARRVIPNLIATDLFGVQPMLGPTTQVFSLQMAMSNAVAVDMGSQAAVVTAKADFDSKAALSANAGITGSLTAVTGTSGTFVAGAGTDIDNFGNLGTFTAGSLAGDHYLQLPAGTEIGYLNLLQEAGVAVTAAFEQEKFYSDGGAVSEIEAKIGTATVTAQTRKLRARWTFEAAQDANNLHGIDLQEELVSALATEIKREIDIELINNSRAAAAAVVVELDDGAGGGIANNNTWQAEKYRAIYQQIVFASQQIAQNTRRGAANWMVTSPRTVAALASISNFSFNQVSGNLNQFADGGVTFVGTLDGRLKVYQNPMAVNDNILLGFKGASVLDAGQVYAPYVPLSISETILNPTDMTPRVGVMTRYGVVKPSQILSGGSYYRELTFVNTAASTTGQLDI